MAFVRSGWVGVQVFLIAAEPPIRLQLDHTLFRYRSKAA
jgi:hypothetical protein